MTEEYEDFKKYYQKRPVKRIEINGESHTIKIPNNSEMDDAQQFAREVKIVNGELVGATISQKKMNAYLVSYFLLESPIKVMTNLGWIPWKEATPEQRMTMYNEMRRELRERVIEAIYGFTLPDKKKPRSSSTTLKEASAKTLTQKSS